MVGPVRSPRRRGTLSPQRRRISDRIAALSSSPTALPQWLYLHLRRLRHRRLLLLTETLSNVSDDLYARLRNQFSEEQLMQLGGQIAFENYRARSNRLFDVESDNLYQGTTAS